MTGADLADTAGTHAADLRYVPPPSRPVLTLHPSRMGLTRTVITARAAGRPIRTAAHLEDRLRAWSGRSDCVLTSSGRGALRLALAGLGAGPGREVVVSTFNCSAVLDAVLACGATPVLVDFDPLTGPAFDSVPLAGRIVVLTNGLGLDERAMHAARIDEAGGTFVLDLAQAVPAPSTLRRHAGTAYPIVLSFGAGKALGGVGGGALLTSAAPTVRMPVQDARSRTARAIPRAALDLALLHAPRRVRSVAGRRQAGKPGWSTTKADHLPAEPAPVPLGGPDRWMLAAAAAGVGSGDRLRRAMTRLHDRVRALVEGTLLTCALPAAEPDLSSTFDLVFERRGHRLWFGRELAALGVPSTWNYYPLHRTPAYGTATEMPSVDRLWPRVLSLPKLPQPRLTAEFLAHAILAADRATAGAADA